MYSGWKFNNNAINDQIKTTIQKVSDLEPIGVKVYNVLDAFGKGEGRDRYSQ